MMGQGRCGAVQRGGTSVLGSQSSIEEDYRLKISSVKPWSIIKAANADLCSRFPPHKYSHRIADESVRCFHNEHAT